MNPYESFVHEFARLLQLGKRFQLGDFPAPPKLTRPPNAPKALIFSPHPDDEVIIGGLALRLLRDLGMDVINVAVTQGSNKARQAARWEELKGCCDYVGFGLLAPRPSGLEGVNLKTRSGQPAQWGESVDCMARILAEQKPRVIFVPHDKDWNSTHIGTHFLVMDALAKLGGACECQVVETEFWAPMDTPNLMVESSPQDVIDLITALSFHAGEVQRNPYHLRLPAWLMDNVRRGGELVGGQGAAAPDFAFATLYRLRRWRGGRLEPVLDKGRFVARTENLAALFPG